MGRLGGGRRRSGTASSYAKDIKPLLNKYCMNCHNDSRPRAGVSVETFGDLTKDSRRPLVVPEKPDDSRIMQTLSGKGKPMPPRRAPQPKAEDIAKVRDWITAGAKDDTAVADDDKKKTPADPAK